MSHIVVGLGEALFDCFGDECVLGGAPVNFAAHVQQLIAPIGGQAFVVSRCGVDELGDRLMKELAQRGLGTNFIQRDATRPTGRVDVVINSEGEPTYSITQNVAWDYLRFDDTMDQLARQSSAVCFGTLTQRSEVSRQAIYQFLSAAEQAIRIFDVNLRQSFYSSEIIEQSLRLATVLKTNAHELQVLGNLMGCQATGEVDEVAFEMCRRFELDLLALTRGQHGTVLFTQRDRFETKVSAAARAADADSVGAGDACCAGIAFGLLQRWSLTQTLELANRMGRFVASCRGATPTLSEELCNFAAQGG